MRFLRFLINSGLSLPLATCRATPLNDNAPLVAEDANKIEPAATAALDPVYVAPYLPFFSSCRGFDSAMVLHAALEDRSACALISPGETWGTG